MNVSGELNISVKGTTITGTQGPMLNGVGSIGADADFRSYYNSNNNTTIHNSLHTPYLDTVEISQLSERLQEPQKERMRRYARKVGVDPIRKDIRVRKLDGYIPADKLIHLSATVKDVDAIKLLVRNYEAEVNTKLDDGWAPLHRAAQVGSANVMNTIAAVSEEENECVNAITDDDNHWTVLHIAALHGNADVIMLIGGLNHNLTDKDLQVLLPLATPSRNGGTASTDKMMPGTIPDNSDSASIISTARSNSDPDTILPEETVRTVRWIGVNPNVWASRRWTPMHCAAGNGNVDAIEALKAIQPSNGYRKADINPRDNDDWTPLHLAAYNGHIGAVVKLIESSAEVNAKCRLPYGATPLYLAKVARKQELDKIKKRVLERVDVERVKGLERVIEYLRRSGGHDISILDVFFGKYAEIARAKLEAMVEYSLEILKLQGATQAEVAVKIEYQ